MNRTLESIFKDIEVLGIKGGYDVEQLITPNDCRILKGEIIDLQSRIDKAIEYIEKKEEKQIAYNFDYWLDDDEIKELLDILKGSDTNGND